MKKFVELSRILFDKLKGRIARFVLFKIFGRVIGGVYGFILSEILGRIIENLRPVYNKTVRKIYIYFKKKKIKESSRKLKESKNEKEFDGNFDNLH